MSLVRAHSIAGCVDFQFLRSAQSSATHRGYKESNKTQLHQGSTSPIRLGLPTASTFRVRLACAHTPEHRAVHRRRVRKRCQLIRTAFSTRLIVCLLVVIPHSSLIFCTTCLSCLGCCLTQARICSLCSPLKVLLRPRPGRLYSPTMPWASQLFNQLYKVLRLTLKISIS